MTESPELPRKLMLLIAAIQGIALLFLYDASASATWPSESPLWNFPLWVIAIAVPVLFLLSIEKGNEIRVAKLIAAFTMLLVPLAIYMGWQATPYNEFPVGGLVFIFVVSVGLACFKALMYIQQRATGKPMSYDVLFTYSWRNSLTLGLSLLLVFVFWLILVLWAQLFRAIDIDFFYDLFRENWFLIPVLSMAHGGGVIIFRNLTRVIDSITRLLAGLIRILLPLVAVVSVVFLSALLFVGLDALWATGRGTSLLLWLLAMLLFFTNAVYQDGRGERPYPLVLHRFLYAALLTTPVISALSFYGLYLRLEEYGWTVLRGWAFVIWLVLTLFSVGYVIGIVRKRDAWTGELARVNSGMGLVVLAIALLANSPLLDFRKMSLNSQLGRLDSGQLLIGDFDFLYAERSLGRPGYLFMEAKKVEVGDSNPELLKKINNPVHVGTFQDTLDSEQLWAKMIYRPTDFEVPAELRSIVSRENVRVQTDVQPVFVGADLDRDGIDEYLFIRSANGYFGGGRLYFQKDGQWQSLPLNVQRAVTREKTNAILDGDISVVPPQFDLLKIGEVMLRPIEKNEGAPE